MIAPTPTEILLPVITGFVGAAAGLFAAYTGLLNAVWNRKREVHEEQQQEDQHDLNEHSVSSQLVQDALAIVDRLRSEVADLRQENQEIGERQMRDLHTMQDRILKLEAHVKRLEEALEKALTENAMLKARLYDREHPSV
jgi:predicted RNase H-like nuclease (RuvC/YqgF family)